MSRALGIVGVCAGALIAASTGLAGQASQSGERPDSGLLNQVAHKHVHLNGHDLLGEKLKHDGKHELGKVKGRTVTADVKGGKVTNMSAGDLPVHRVKSAKRMADSAGGLIRVGLTSPLQLAQYDETYYGYCFDDGVEYTCYWYPASDVVYQDYTWDPYDPTY